MNWYVAVLKNYVGFSGRARRKEYWMFTLVNVIVAVALAVVGALVETNIPYYLYLAAILLPSLAVGVRRLHDTNRSGWWTLIALVPFGSLVLFVFFVTAGDLGPNAYGEDPKDAPVTV
ncbi:DUF805 domain-containing protein [Longispora sp. NPDC051575]|uniref:DUF805 domain-containing protein n=1 Tax=Longispora sp. NPDC051575 TaxID=3154943 RepID=UPI0034329BB7